MEYKGPPKGAYKVECLQNIRNTPGYCKYGRKYIKEFKV